MPIAHCHHIKENGFFCQQPAMRGRNYCFTHLRVLGRRMRMARERARQQSLPLLLPLLEDMDAVMVALSQVLDAHADGRISERSAGLMLYGLQQAASNLEWMDEKAAAQDSEATEAGGERAQDYPGFEAEFGLPENFDLAQPPEVAFPPPPETALPRAPEPSPYRASNSWQNVAPEDVELEELYNTGNEAAYHQRRKKLMARSMGQVLEHKRKVAEARWVLEADRRNLEAMVGTPAEREAHEKEVVAMREQARLDAAKKSPSMSDNPGPQLQAQSVGTQAPSSKKPPNPTVAPEPVPIRNLRRRK
jgi:hypothetical protein